MSPLRRLLLLIFLTLLFGSSNGQEGPENCNISGNTRLLNPAYKASLYIPPIPANPSAAYYGSRIQRTLSLLSGSSASRRNRVRILFYGQSIVQGLDSKSMVEYLQEKYPHAIIEYENRAIGGFQAPNLVRTAVHDLYPYYPDLLIFHVYGGEETGDLERIIYNTRKYTTSDILLFNHHLSWDSDPEKLQERIQKDDLSSEYWRYLAQKYGCELVDVRNHWKTYLDTYPHIHINTLMGDTIHSNVHPNAKGNKLLESLILEHLQPNPNLVHLPCTGWGDNVRDYEIKRYFEEKKDEVIFEGEAVLSDAGVKIENGFLKLNFTGNRAVLNTVPGGHNAGEVIVLIDNRPPSENPELYYSTRPSKAFNHWRPAIKRVSPGKDPILEKWKLTITKIDRDSGIISFEVYGSITGFDGSGDNRKDFVSNSGRIIIEAADFFIFESEAYTRKPTPVGFDVEWEVKPLFHDTIRIEPGIDSYCIARGLENTHHALKLIIVNTIEIRSITIHTPPIH